MIMKNICRWFNAIRPKTLLVSMASVVMAVSLSFNASECQWLPALLCLLFAVTAQATSNLVNDYADFHTGSDNVNSLGPDRKMVSGEITPKIMKKAITVAAICCLLIGLPLIYWGGWVLLPFGLIIIAVAFMYSTGPFPLSYHALGDVAVVLFYGIIPVTFTYYILTASVDMKIMAAGLAMGLVVDELLIVNNYRDAEDDALHNKITTVGLFGKKAMRVVFLFNPLIACALGFYFMQDVCSTLVWSIAIIPIVVYSLSLFFKLGKYKGKELNALLGMASLEAVLFAATVMIAGLI